MVLVDGKTKYSKDAKLSKMNLLMQYILSQNTHRSFFYRTWQADFKSSHGRKNAQKYKNCFGKESGSEGGFSLPE